MFSHVVYMLSLLHSMNAQVQVGVLIRNQIKIVSFIDFLFSSSLFSINSIAISLSSDRYVVWFFDVFVVNQVYIEFIFNIHDLCT